MKEKSWFKRHWIISMILTFFILMILWVLIEGIIFGDSNLTKTNNSDSLLNENNSQTTQQNNEYPSIDYCLTFDLQSGKRLPCTVYFAKNNPSICEKYFSPNLQEYWVGACYYHVAIEKNNPNLCTSVCAYDTSPYLNEGYCWDCNVHFDLLSDCQKQCKDEYDFNKCYYDCLG